MIEFNSLRDELFTGNLGDGRVAIGRAFTRLAELETAELGKKDERSMIAMALAEYSIVCLHEIACLCRHVSGALVEVGLDEILKGVMAERRERNDD